MNSGSRRKLSNLFIDRGALARLSVPFVGMILIGVGIVFTIHSKVMFALQNTQLAGIENLAAMNSLLEAQRSVTTVGSIGIVLLGLLSFGSWIFLSHKIFGPTIPIRRHVQSLSEGDYNSRIELRSGDELKGLADDLNKLAESLSRKKR